LSANPLFRGLTTLRHALLEVLEGPPIAPAWAVAGAAREPRWLTQDDLFDTAAVLWNKSAAGALATHTNHHGDAELATSSAEDAAEGTRLIGLVELARSGDKDAFGLLYDHYHVSVYRFLYYRVGTAQLAEDLTSETFFRALRSMNSFRWQGKDFGAWLMTIARNLAADHFKAGRTRLEFATEDERTLDGATEGPERQVLASLTNETLLKALAELPTEQRECLIMRFLQGLSIAETAEVLGRSTGAVKQLQLRGVRNLAKLLPEGTQR
jgi:RNA polymerase sigma-70 factor (ECF subfamily)